MSTLKDDFAKRTAGNSIAASLRATLMGRIEARAKREAEGTLILPTEEPVPF
jgi:hypothetical protein